MTLRLFPNKHDIIKESKYFSYPDHTQFYTFPTSTKMLTLYEERLENKKNLLITIGDSWTWGDSLPPQSRTKDFYTNTLSEKLEADWLCIAWCGIDNEWILEQALRVADLIKCGFYSRYENIYVHTCFTELYREIIKEKYNYEKFRDIIDGIKENDFVELSEKYFQKTVLENLPMTTNFSYSTNFWNLNFDKVKYNFIPTYWQKHLFDHENILDDQVLPAISGLGVEPMAEYIDDSGRTQLKMSFSEKLKGINARIDLMQKCDLNYKEATKHPVKKGHDIWADIVFDHMIKK